MVSTRSSSYGCTLEVAKHKSSESRLAFDNIGWSRTERKIVFFRGLWRHRRPLMTKINMAKYGKGRSTSSRNALSAIAVRLIEEYFSLFAAWTIFRHIYFGHYRTTMTSETSEIRFCSVLPHPMHWGLTAKWSHQDGRRKLLGFKNETIEARYSLFFKSVTLCKSNDNRESHVQKPPTCINREFKELWRQLQRKRHIKIELCVKCFAIIPCWCTFACLARTVIM